MAQYEYRTLPVVVEAFRLGYDIAPNWFKVARNCGFIHDDHDSSSGIHIETSAGALLPATDGDMIICDKRGEIWPCKQDIFRASYESIK